MSRIADNESRIDGEVFCEYINSSPMDLTFMSFKQDQPEACAERATAQGQRGPFSKIYTYTTIVTQVEIK